jgi:hypothetical protein
MEFIVLVVVIVLIAVAINAKSPKIDQQRQIAYEAIKRVPALLEQRTGQGPWYELNDFYREHFVDIKCTSCEIDCTWACNEHGETEFADLHYKAGKTQVTYGNDCLFDGDALQLLSYGYAGNTYRIGKDRIPPEGTWAHNAHCEYMKSHSASDAD